MGSTSNALGGVLLQAVPTFLLIIFLYFFLKSVFLKPMLEMRRKRFDATEGARRRAQESLERAAAKTAEYEAALRSARAAVYQQQDKLHQQLQEQQAAELLAVRKQAEATIQEARAALAKDAEGVKAGLARDAEQLASEIADSLLRRSAA
jgi:F-type H+-transporting ATPase subunit b